MLWDANWNGRQLAEKDGVIGLGEGHQLEQLVHHGGVIAVQAELAGPHGLERLLHRCSEAIADLIEP